MAHENGDCPFQCSQCPRVHNSNRNAIEELVPLEPQDRLGRLLELEPLQAGEIAALDLELWHTGDRQEMRKYIDQIRQDLRSCSTETAKFDLTDSYIGEYLCIARIKVNQTILNQLLNELIVKEIDRRPRVAFAMRSEFNPSLSEIPTVNSPPPYYCGILLIDTGISRGHPLLAPVIGEAEVFPDTKRQFIQGGAEDEANHGTGVAAIAAYGDVEACIRKKSFDSSAWIYSARVMNERNEFDEDLLLENQLEQAILYFINQYPNCKVINLSLGNAEQIYRDGSKQFRIAAKLDELAYRYQHKNLVFVVSAGNSYRYPHRDERERLRTDYPNYLFDPESRIIDPATSEIALTVGSLSLGRGSMTYPDDARRNTVTKVPGYPSPFTRVGFGVDGMIKPELVDWGGDIVLDGDRKASDNESGVSIVTFSQNYSSSLFQMAIGTSFAAPRVSNLAAQLFTKYPEASSNLIRALVSISAELPVEIPPALQVGLKLSQSQKSEQLNRRLSIYGYGQADLQRAMYSADNYAVLLEDHLDIAVGSFEIFEIPALPPEYLRTRGVRRLSIALAFDPPTRPTRGDSYLGITMEFSLFKGVEQASIVNAYINAKRAKEAGDKNSYSEISKEILSKQFGYGCEVDLSPNSTLRKKGTLQRGSIDISSVATKYDQGPLHLVVTCNRKWVKVEDIPSQRYALVVAVEHSDPGVKLYNRLRTAIEQRLNQLSQQIRIRQ
ncbi:S8 family peptidase [Leptolyngbya sp. NIES-2104]|uniref:S8 family peptidase n=1 Tax=Leptolyngbya sp. NIES-2104 TaxID=1552121 RepID=UPI0006ECA390|nr:S8 family peptidase [Leptolyngbya sp. NIES-2104]GAP99687.1 putative serine protease [Leptolyngbya sp. NIES-2104]